MWWKKKETDNLNIYIEHLQILKKANLELRELYSQLTKFSISNNLIKIIKISDKIFDELMINKNKIVKMNLYIEYYIQEVLKITRQYLKIRTLKDEESINLCEIIEEFIKDIKKIKAGNALAKYPMVESVSLMSGVCDLIVVVKGRTFQEVSSFVAHELATIDSVTSTATQFIMKKYKDHGVLLLDEDVDERDTVSL